MRKALALEVGSLLGIGILAVFAFAYSLPAAPAPQRVVVDGSDASRRLPAVSNLHEENR